MQPMTNNDLLAFTMHYKDLNKVHYREVYSWMQIYFQVAGQEIEEQTTWKKKNRHKKEEFRFGASFWFIAFTQILISI